MQRAGTTLCCGGQASQCGGFSCCRAWALERKLSSCGAWAYLLHRMWDLLGPGMEPVSSALTGGLLTTAPPGKSNATIFVSCLPFNFNYAIFFENQFKSKCNQLCQAFHSNSEFHIIATRVQPIPR